MRKRYINGKYFDINEETTSKLKSRFGRNMPNNRRHNSNRSEDYEARIKELENTVATLLTKLSESEQK